MKVYQPNLAAVIEQANHMFSYILFLYSKNMNLDSIGFSGGAAHFQGRKQSSATYWIPPLNDWIKWNADASRIDLVKPTTINYVCRNDNGASFSIALENLLLMFPCWL